MYHPFFVHSSVDGQLDCFHALAVVDSAAVNIWVHVYFQVLVISGYVPMSGVAGLYGNSIFISYTDSFSPLFPVFHMLCFQLIPPFHLLKDTPPWSFKEKSKDIKEEYSVYY